MAFNNLIRNLAIGDNVYKYFDLNGLNDARYSKYNYFTSYSQSI